MNDEHALTAAGPQQPDLLVHVLDAYLSSTDGELTNHELYAAVARSGALSPAALSQVEAVGRAGRRHNLGQRAVRWTQQTLKGMGLVEHAAERGVWRLAERTRTGLHAAAPGVQLVAFSTRLGVAVWGACESVLAGLDQPITLCCTSPPYLLTGDMGGHGSQMKHRYAWTPTRPNSRGAGLGRPVHQIRRTRRRGKVPGAGDLPFWKQLKTAEKMKTRKSPANLETPLGLIFLVLQRRGESGLATLEVTRHTPHRPEVREDRVEWVPISGRKVIDRLPQIVWSDEQPWREANLWALEQLTTGRKNAKTVMSSMTSLHAYAKWLEAESLDWWHFPAKEAERCLVRYRGALIDARDAGQLAPSTVQNRMAVVVRFYRWLSANRLISPEWPMWRDRQVGVRITDSFGFDRTLRMTSTDLAIPNRKPIGECLEDGLLPVSAKDRDLILAFANENASEELALMLRLGFRTGMRFGTIADLKVKTIERAVPDPSFPGWNRLSVGPAGKPPVHTKFGVSGQVWIESSDLERLKIYAFSSRRLKRQAVASEQDRDCLFLTRYGGRYGTEGSDLSRSMNVELGRLRNEGVAQGIKAFRNFRFHQSRCTFATELARVAIKHGSVSIAIRLVKQALLHRNEASTLRYIQFVERTAAMADAADAFTQSFLGLVIQSESV